MKILLLVFFSLLSFNAVGQHIEKKIIKSEIKVKTKPAETEYQYEDSKGVLYPVYKGSRGGYFIIKTSKKTGKTSKQYITSKISNKKN